MLVQMIYAKFKNYMNKWMSKLLPSVVKDTGNNLLVKVQPKAFLGPLQNKNTWKLTICNYNQEYQASG